MAAIDLKRDQWKSYFEGLTGYLEGKQACVEVAARALGHRVAAQWTPLVGMTYEDRDDILDLRLGDLSHIIRRPVCIYLLMEGGAVSCIEVIDAEGVTHIVRLRDAVPPPDPAK